LFYFEKVDPLKIDLRWPDPSTNLPKIGGSSFFTLRDILLKNIMTNFRISQEILNKK